MKKRKTLQDLTIKDNCLFGAVMQVEENCRGFLELVLGFPIAHVVVSKEKSMVYHPEYKDRLIIDGNAVYEIDEECLRQKEEAEKKQNRTLKGGRCGMGNRQTKSGVHK